MLDPNPAEPANVEVEVLETIKLVRVVEPSMELTEEASSDPPVIVSPPVEESPVESSPLKVEEAVEDFTCSISTESPLEKDEVPVVPVSLNPPAVISIPPAKVEEAALPAMVVVDVPPTSIDPPPTVSPAEV